MRPQGWTKHGYFPTPSAVTELIARQIIPHVMHDAPLVGNVLLLDPCAGAGDALAQFAADFQRELNNEPGWERRPVITHGIEPQQERCRQAQKQLTYCWRAGIEDAVLPPNSYDCIWLNPPYDWDRDLSEFGARRLESYFLEVCTPALKPYGTLIYIVPQHVLELDANYLAVNYADHRCARFPDPEYDQFRQSVFIGQRRPQLYNSFAMNHGDYDRLREHSAAGAAAPHWRAAAPAEPFHAIVQPTPETVPLPTITVTQMPDASLQAALQRHSAWHNPDFNAQITPQDQLAEIRPLEPLRSGHICILAANGQLDNVPIYDPAGELDPVVIKGSARKVKDVSAETDQTVTEQEHFRAQIAYLNLRTGAVDNITEPAAAIAQFLSSRGEALAQAVARRYPPRFDPSAAAHASRRQRLAILKRDLKGKQAPSAITAAAALDQDGHVIIAAQQGSGKTMLAIAAATANHYARMLVVTPPHNIDTWRDEIAATHPTARIRVINGIGNPNFPDRATFHHNFAVCDLETLRQTPATPERPVWALLKRDSAKMTYPYAAPARTINAPTESGHTPRLFRNHLGELLKPAQNSGNHVDTCPHCWITHASRPNHDWHSRNSRCPECGEYLAGPDISVPGDRRYPWADYIAKRMPRWADLFVADEVHQFKNKRSAQGDVFRRLGQASRRTMALTGTVIGGKAQEAFYLLYGFSPPFARHYGFHDLGDFNKAYGRMETTYEKADPAPGGDRRNGARSSVRRGRKLGVKILNGFHPALLNHFWPHTIFTRIHDIKRDLPPLRTYARLIPLDDNAGRPESQQNRYFQLHNALYANLKDHIKRGSMRPAAQLLQSLLAYPENCWQGDCPTDPETGEVIIDIPPLPADTLYPKETALIELLHQEKSRGRKALVYCTHTNRRDVTARLERLLNAAGLEVAVMRSDAGRRLRWLQDAAHKYDAVICQPKSVETGLNLLDYPTICWYEIDYSMYTVEQASARSYRINQTQPIEVHYLAYADTMQERALRAIAAKADTARAMYGELAATGLSAFNPENADLRTLIARQLYESLRNGENDAIDAASAAAQRAVAADCAIINDAPAAGDIPLADIDYDAIAAEIAGYRIPVPALSIPATAPPRRYSDDGSRQPALF